MLDHVAAHFARATAAACPRGAPLDGTARRRGQPGLGRLPLIELRRRLDRLRSRHDRSLVCFNNHSAEGFTCDHTRERARNGNEKGKKAAQTSKSRGGPASYYNPACLIF